MQNILINPYSDYLFSWKSTGEAETAVGDVLLIRRLSELVGADGGRARALPGGGAADPARGEALCRHAHRLSRGPCKGYFGFISFDL